MVKSILFLTPILTTTMTLPTLSIIISSIMLTFPIMYTHQQSLNSWIYIDSMSLTLILLTLMSITLILMASTQLKTLTPLMNSSLMILILTFSCSKIIMFYISFEIILIPILLIITQLGKQPERLQAALYLIMYTIMASLPLLISILLSFPNSSFQYNSLMMTKFNFPLLVIMAFLVKMPMFLTHLWLPKAHVEAPLEGSMILAAILLKLGGYGIIRFLPMIFHKLHKINYWIISISLIGASLTSMNCIRQKDLKALIAYSSVAHMGLVLASILTINKTGYNGAIIMMVAHGLTSSGLFFLVNIMYSNFHSRNISLFKGLWPITPNLTFWWFVFSALNISAPPSINIVSETMMMSSLISWSTLLIPLIALTTMLSSTFSILMFSNINHTQTSYSPLISPHNKSSLTLFLHSTPLILLIMKMDLMT